MPSHAVKRRKLDTSEERDDYSNDKSEKSVSNIPETSSHENDEDELSIESGSGEEMETDNEEKAERNVNMEKEKISQAEKKRRRPNIDRISQSELLMAGETSKSGLFKLQIDELLADIHPKYEKHMPKLERILRKIKNIIEGIPDSEPVSIAEAEKKMRKQYSVVIPFPNPKPKKDVKYTLAYKKPANVNVVGNFALRLGIRSETPAVIDVAVTLPSDLFQEKDYLNYRYFHKRAFYVACLAAGLREAKSSFKINFEYQNNNTLQPVISIIPSGKGDEEDFSSTNYRIRIITAIPESTFQISKTFPNKNCVRSAVNANESTEEKPEPTSFYNSTLRSESTVTSFQKLLSSMILQCPAFRDAAALGQVWLQQRGFDSSFSGGGFGHFEWSAVCANLLQTGGPNGTPLLSRGYSSYQLFKAMIQILATRDMNSPMMLNASNLSLPRGDSPVFFDGSRGLNILFKMTFWSYKLLRQEAKILLEMLNDPLRDNFSASFIQSLSSSLLFRFDLNLELSIPPEFSSSLRQTQFSQKIYHALSKGLSNRATLIHLSLPLCRTWKLTSAPCASQPFKLLVSILVNPETVNRLVDHGPPAEDTTAASYFRQFWGPKSELRRFKDGSIRESLVWSASNADGLSVLQQIILYILHRQAGEATAQSCTFIANNAEKMLLPKDPAAATQSHTPFQPIMEAFRTLENDIRSHADSLPLTLRQISAASPQLRYSSSIIPLTDPSHPSTQPADILIQFEVSTRWPSNLPAIQMAKFAFLVKISDLLSQPNSYVTAKVGIENEGNEMMNHAFLDITYPSGAFFRLRIHHEHEVTLLSGLLASKSTSPSQRALAAAALVAYKRTFVHSPSHTQSLATLCTRFPLLSPTIRAFKRFCTAHLLMGPSHVREEVVELIATVPFLHHHPYLSPPASLSTAFFRTLEVMGRWSYPTDPLLLSFGGALEREDIHASTVRFQAWRKLDPGLNRTVLFLGTKNDLDGTAWTTEGPSKVIAARWQGLCKAALEVIRSKETEISGQDMKQLFVPWLRDYDFLLHISPKFTGSSKRKAESRFKNLALQEFDNTPELATFDPLPDLLSELHALYGENVILFWNPGAKVIAGLWNRGTVPVGDGGRKWRVGLGWSSMPVEVQKSKAEDEDVDVRINKEGILHEIAILAGDLVERVEIFSQ
ncbi:MAG: hypothetical protein M1834_008889 [Cirrosporium novae-zelandiae]|nr:MAG: hypothetical protein M1834_008889 [Cirrosporium novae-zelandiae]